MGGFKISDGTRGGAVELYQLRTFVAVAEEGNLTRAADRLHVSQPAVSAHVKALEEELGVILFLRTSRGMQLTPEGEQLKVQAEKALETIDQLRSRARDLARELSGELTLGLHTDPAFLRIGPFLSCMRKRFPGLSFNLVQAMSWEVTEALTRERMDAAFLYGDTDDPRLSVLRLQEMTLRIVGPFAWKDRIARAGWKEIAGLPWVWIPPQCPFHQAASDLFDARGLKPFKVAVADQEPILKSLVASGVGMALMIEEEARQAEEEGKVTVWKPGKASISLALATLKSRASDPLIRAVLSGLEEVWAG